MHIKYCFNEYEAFRFYNKVRNIPLSILICPVFPAAMRHHHSGEDVVCLIYTLPLRQEVEISIL